jgi:RNA polymerase sigma-70 factor (ECF subfamily)
VPDPDATCWTLIRDASAGDPAARERFARVYLPAVRSYLAARWRGLPLDADDAVQDVFVECFRTGGALAKADAEWPGGFRAFLLGVVRNVARRHEAKPRGGQPLDPQLPADDPSLSKLFDRAWAQALLREAARVQRQAADTDAQRRRVELLRLRFHDGRPIRDIAKQWGVDAAKLHHEYATAREEFRQALRHVVAFHHPGEPPAVIDRACADLLALVS